MVNYSVKIFALALLFFLCFSCEHDPIIPDPYWGTVNLQFNGDSIQFKPHCSEVNGLLAIYLRDVRKQQVFNYEIGFLNLEKKEYTIDSLVNFYEGNNSQLEYSIIYVTQGGDILTNVFNPFTEPDNFLRINSWDEVTQEIKGEFNLSYVRDSAFWHNHTVIDTIRITNGTFHTRL